MGCSASTRTPGFNSGNSSSQYSGAKLRQMSRVSSGVSPSCMAGLARPRSVGCTTNPSLSHVRRVGIPDARPRQRAAAGQRRLAVRRRHVRRPGDQHQRAAFGRLVDEIGQILQGRGAQQRRIDVAEDHHVVGEQFVAPQGKDPQGRGVLLGVLQVGVLQDRVQRDRLVALKHVAEIAELETRIGLHQQDANLLLAHLDRPRLPVVLRLKLARLRLGFHDELELADLGGAEGNADRLRLAVGPDGHFHLGQHGRLALFAERRPAPSAPRNRWPSACTRS